SRILASMNVLEEVEGAGAAQLAGMVIRAPNGVRVVGEFAGCSVKGFRDRGLSVRREILDAILLRAARDAGAEVREALHVVDVARDATGRACGVRTVEGRELSADLVVGADGLRSIVARRLGLARSARWPRRYALVTHYRGVGEITDIGEMHVERGGYVGIADVGEGLTTVARATPLVAGRGARRRRGRFLRSVHRRGDLRRVARGRDAGVLRGRRPGRRIVRRCGRRPRRIPRTPPARVRRQMDRGMAHRRR